MNSCKYFVPVSDIVLFIIVLENSQFIPKTDRRRSSCLPMPTFGLSLKLRKPQWRKRCMAITHMITIYIMLWLCWAPIIIEYTVDVYSTRPSYVFHIEGTFVYLNSAFNVLMYSLMNKSFRKAHGRFLCKCFRFGDRHSPTIF